MKLYRPELLQSHYLLTIKLIKNQDLFFMWFLVFLVAFTLFDVFFYYKSNGFERVRKKQFDQKLSAQKREVCRKCLHVKLLLQKHYEEFRGIMDFTTSHQNKKSLNILDNISIKNLTFHVKSNNIMVSLSMTKAGVST